MPRFQRPLFLALLLSCLCAAPGRAVFTASQMERVDDEPLFDEHYFVSLRSFAYPLAWEDLWRSTSAPAYRIDAASLDCCQLLLSQELRFDREVTKGLTFRFRLIQQEDKERQELHHWLELEKSVAGGFSASVLGEPTFQKGDSDFGFGLVFRRRRLRVAAKHYFVDFDFNRRGGTHQRDLRSPATDEVVVEWEPRFEHRLSAYLEVDHPLRRTVPDEHRLFSYRRTTVRAAWRRLVPAAWNPRVEYGYELQEKSDDFAPDPAAASIAHRRQVHRLLTALDVPLSARDGLDAGHVLLARAARSDFRNAPGSGLFYQRWEAQPYARWRRELRPWLTSDLGGFLSFGDNRKRAAGGAALVDQRLVEAKAAAGLDFVFSAGRIGLNTTWDLDAPAHPWGGGNIRAMFFF